jgi:glycosyltransferase involved in cell wall biosynthesis
MLFSVVIPAFNRAAFLPATLASVWAQTFTDFEIIIVDDGSTDGTRDYLASVGRNLRVIVQPQSGPGSARNAGAAEAGGEYLAFLDSDDVWFPWTLAAFANVIRDASPSVIAGSFFDFSSHAEVAGVKEDPLDYRRFDDYLSSSTHAISTGSGTVVIRRATFADSGGFTEQRINGEDHDLMLRLGTARGFAQVQAPITLAWRRHPGTETTDVDRSITGMTYLIEQERGGAYPGGDARASERRRIIARHVRPVTFQCLREGRVRPALNLFGATLLWNAAEGHFAYLCALPVLGVWTAARRIAR